MFTAFAALYDFSRATLLSLPLLVLSAAVASGAAVLFGERLVTTRRHARVLSPLLHAWKRPAAIAIVVVIVLALGVPISILVREAAGPSLVTALGNSGQAILNSLMLCSAGATVVVAVSICLVTRGREPAAVLDTLQTSRLWSCSQYPARSLASG